jgi:preprotein translocase subunit SecD
MRHIIKPFVLCLAASLLTSACSHKTESSGPPSKPQFIIAAADLAGPAEISTNGIGTGHDTIVIHLQFSAKRADEFRQFTREHLNQDTQLVVGTRVVAEPHVAAEISGGQADLSFSTFDQAKVVADALSQK